VPHQSHFAIHVNGLVALSGLVHTLFPEGSQGGDALPAIWENPDDFASKVNDFESAAGALKAAMDSGGDIGAAFQQVGQACKGCHDDYREE
jgi:cytochrome c556